MTVAPLVAPRLGQPPAAVFARMKARVAEQHILDRSLSFYIPMIVATFVVYGLSFWAVYHFDAILPLTLACLLNAFMVAQLAGLMHDGGHHAIFRSPKANNFLGFLAAASIGMIIENWKLRHNMHHLMSNQDGKDPDLEIPFIATNEAIYLRKSTLQKRFVAWQAYYYYPLGCIVGLSNRLGSITYFARNPSREKLGQFVAYVPAIFVLFVSPFLLFSIEKALFVFLLVHLSTGIYLANRFAPNHKGMPVLPEDSDLSYVEQQIVTSRSVQGGWLTTFFLVGLNHQVEHHLFPACPRNKLHQLRPLVIEACEELGIEYPSATLLDTNRFILRQLQGVSNFGRSLDRNLQPAD